MRLGRRSLPESGDDTLTGSSGHDETVFSQPSIGRDTISLLVPTLRRTGSIPIGFSNIPATSTTSTATANGTNTATP